MILIHEFNPLPFPGYLYPLFGSRKDLEAMKMLGSLPVLRLGPELSSRFSLSVKEAGVSRVTLALTT